MPEVRKQLKKFPEIEIARGQAPVQADAEGIEAGLFEDLLESVREAGAILRGEREAARRTRCYAAAGSDPTQEHERSTRSEWPFRMAVRLRAAGMEFPPVPWTDFGGRNHAATFR